MDYDIYVDEKIRISWRSCNGVIVNNSPVNFIDSLRLWTEAIHNDIIDTAFADLPASARDAIKLGSKNADACAC